MQELTRSMMRFSWAMPLLGVNMMSNLVAPGNGRNPLEATADALDSLTHAAQTQMGNEIQRTYEAGARLQDNVIDAVFGAIPAAGQGMPNPFNGGR